MDEMPQPSHDDRLLAIENAINQLADGDAQWWPFAFLRPEPHERLGNLRCLALAVLHALPATLLATCLAAIAGSDRLQSGQLLALGSSGCLAALVLFRVRAAAWNRRATRLRPLAQRRIAWQASLRASEGSSAAQAHDQRDDGHHDEADE
jgi:hypothetical protein